MTRVPLLRGFAANDLPVMADANEIVLIAKPQHQVVEWAVLRLHVITDDPALDESSVAFDLDVLVADEMHRRVPGVQSLFHSVQIFVELTRLRGPDADTVGMKNGTH